MSNGVSFGGMIWGKAAWDLLGLESGADRQAIRRAYAVKLKATHPEDDPEGFQRLRQAYEWALNWGDAAVWDIGDEAAQAEDEAPAPETTPEPPEPQAAAPVWDEDQRQLEAARTRLERLVEQNPPASRDALDAALAEILASPAMDLVDVRLGVEAWLAHLAANAPRTEPLASLAIRAFGWDTGRGDRTAQALVDRQERLTRLRTRAVTYDPWIRAVAVLQPGPAWKRLALALLEPGLTRKMRSLLEDMEDEDLLGASLQVDPTALDWWRRWLDSPKPAAGGVLAALAAPLLAVWWRADLAVAGPTWLVAQAICLAVLAGEVFLVQWPRRLWRERWAWRAPVWTRVAPLAVATVLIMAAAALPAVPPWLWVIGGLSGAAVLASAILGEADPRPEDRLPWTVSALILQGPMAVVWLLLIRPGIGPQALQLTLAVMAAMAVSAFSMSAGVQAWLSIGRMGRLLGMILLAGLIVFIGLTLGPVQQDLPELRPWTAALTALTVLLHRPLAAVMPHGAHRVRVYLQWMGTIPIYIFVITGSVLIDAAQIGPGLMLAGGVVWLLAGVAVAVVASLIQHEAEEKTL